MPRRSKLPASHVAYMSHPKETVKLIEEAATPPRASIINRKEDHYMKPSNRFFHMGSGPTAHVFQKLIPTLRAEGHQVIAAQYGLDTVKRRTVDATIRSFGRVSGPIVLVGHSYGRKPS